MAPWRRPRLRRRLQLLCVAAATLLGIDLLRWASIGGLEISRSDYPALATGGVLLARGERAHIYDPSRQAQVYNELIRGAHSGSLPFNHAPLSAILYAPFSSLPLGTAYHAFGLFQALCVLAGCLLALHAAPWPHGCPRLVKSAAMLAALAGAGTLPLLLEGQDAGVIALAVGAAYLSLRRNRALLAGTLLGLAALGTKPHLLLGLFALIAVRRDLRLLAGTVAGALLAVLGWVATVGPAGCASFLRVALSSSGGWPWHWFLGLDAVPTSLLGETQGARAVGLLLSLAALALAGCLAGRWRASGAAMEGALAGAACLSLAAAVHLLGHDLVILAPLLVAMAGRAVAEAGAPRRLALLLAAWGLLLGATAVDAALGYETHVGRATAYVLVALAAGCAVSVGHALGSETVTPLQLHTAN